MTKATSTREMLATLLAKADQKLDVARRDLNSGDFGDAVSRAYYAVFHALTAVLLERGLSYSSHGQALGAFNRELVKTGVFPRTPIASCKSCSTTGKPVTTESPVQ